MAAIRTSLREFTLRNEVYAGSSVTAFLPDANGAPTVTKAILYVDQIGATTLGNPQTLDGEGKLLQPVYFEVPIVLSISSAFAGAHDTGVIRPSLDTADVAAAAQSAQDAATAAGAAASSAAAAAAAATAASSTWPTYWRHESLSRLAA